MAKLLDWMEEEDIWNFLDRYAGAEEGHGEYIGPIFERFWHVDPMTYTRGMIRASEDLRRLGDTYDEYEKIPLTQIVGRWVVQTYGNNLMNIWRMEDEDGE